MSDFQLQIREHGSEIEMLLHQVGHSEHVWQGRVSADLHRLQQLSVELQRLLSRACGHAGGNQEDHDDFQSLIGLLTQLSLPEELTRELASLKDSSIALDIVPSLSHLPWELMQVEGECLCLRNGLSRAAVDSSAVEVSATIEERSPKLGVVANPEFNLPAASREADVIRRLVAGRPSVGRPRVWTHNVTRAALHEAFKNSDWLHFAGHAVTEQGRTSWMLCDGPFGAREIAAAESLTWPRFVFAHACASAGGDIAVSDDEHTIATLADAFLSVGVQHYLGTIVPVLDEDCREAAGSFYRRILAGEPIATALQQTRQSLIATLGPHNLLWACYILYGPPTVSLLSQDLADGSLAHQSSAQPAALVPVAESDCKLPVVCAVCAKTIRTRHGIVMLHGEITCRQCARSTTQPCGLSTGFCDTALSDEQQTETVEARRRELRFLDRFEYSARRFQERRHLTDGKRQPVRLEFDSSGHTGEPDNRFTLRDTTEEKPNRPTNEWRRYRIAGSTFTHRSSPQVLDVRVYCRESDSTKQQISDATVGREELIALLDQAKKNNDECKVLLLASLTGWADDARLLARTFPETDAHDSNTAIVLVDLIDGAIAWCADDVRLVPLAPLFDFEDDTEKIARIVRHIRRCLPLETSLSASQIATELKMPTDLVEAAFRIVGEDRALQLDECSQFGLVLSQTQF